MDPNISTRLMEAVQRDTVSFPGGWEGIKATAGRSAFFNKSLKEGLYSDMSGALGGIHDRVIEAATPEAVGRDMIWVVPSTEALVRFFKQKLARAYVVGETAPPQVPERMEYSDIQPTTEIAAKGEFSTTYLEDASWPVIQREIDEVGRAIAQLETEKIFAMYDGVAAGSLASGAVVATNDGSSFVWADVVKLWNTVEKENFHAKAMFLNPAEVEGLLNDDKFLNANYYAPESIIRTGQIGFIPVLGMNIYKSTLITAGTKLCIDTDWAAAMVLRREITTVPYEAPDRFISGIIASERMGLGTLRTKAIAKGT